MINDRLLSNEPIVSKGKRRTREPVVAELLTRIARGDIAIGGLMPTEQELVVEFGMSRTVIREVIQDLIGFGMIQTRPRVGARVQPVEQWDRFNPLVLKALLEHGLNADLYESLREARWLIEPEVAAMAAARATAEQIGEINAAFEKLADTVHPDKAVTPEQRMAADIALHRAILGACGNWVFERFGPLFDASIMARMALAQQAPRTDPPLALEKHRRIVDAIKAHNPSEARRATLSVLALSKPAFSDYFDNEESASA